MLLTSPAFENEAEIPRRFSCEGEDKSPPLSWTAPPPGTRCLVLLCEDPDAPLKTFTHWVLFDIPSEERSLPEGLAREGAFPNGARQGDNDFGRRGYDGPCPPTGPYHRYYFKLYALDELLGLDAGASRGAVEKAMRGHVLGQAELMGRFRKVRLGKFVRTMLGRK